MPPRVQNYLISDWREKSTEDIVRGLAHRNHAINAYGDDQDFLGKIIYPLINNNCFEHSDFGIGYFNQTYKIKSNRIDYEFVGDVFDENNNRHPEYWKIIKNVIG